MSVFYDLASLVLVPSGYKAQKVYAQKPLTADGQLTFSRASTATRVNASGLIEAVSSNVPRLDYTNSTCPKLLLEPQRTNLLTYSEAFNVGWTATESTVTTDVTAGPNGVSSADKITAGTNNSLHLISKSITDTAAPWTYSVFAKAAGHDRIILNTYNTNYVGFNLTSGVVESSLGSGITSASIQNYANGWYRCSITSTSVSSGISVALSVFNAAYTNGNTNPIFTGNETDGVFIWGAQFEAGAYPSSYIPAEGTAVTRLADACSKGGLTSLINSTQGVWYYEFSTVNEELKITSITDGTANNYILFYALVPGTMRAAVGVSGSGLVFGIDAPVTATNTNKFAIRWNNGSYAYYVNGALISSASGLPSWPANTLNFLKFTNEANIYPFEGKVAKMLIFPTALTNAQMAELTSL
jgi:hypothetical protein